MGLYDHTEKDVQKHDGQGRWVRRESGSQLSLDSGKSSFEVTVENLFWNRPVGSIMTGR